MKNLSYLWSTPLIFTLLISVSSCEQADNIKTVEDETTQQEAVDCADSDVLACCADMANKAKDGVNAQIIETASGDPALVLAATFTDRSLMITSITPLQIQPGPGPKTLSYKVEVASSPDPNYDNGGNAMLSTKISLTGYDRQQDQLELIVPMPDGTLDHGAGMARRKIRGLMADEQK